MSQHAGTRSSPLVSKIKRFASPLPLKAMIATKGMTVMKAMKGMKAIKGMQAMKAAMEKPAAHFPAFVGAKRLRRAVPPLKAKKGHP